MVAALGLLALVEVVGLLAAPVAALLLGRLPGAGLGFAKVLGLLLVTWVIWMAASLRVVAYGVPLIAGVLVLLAVAGLLCARRLRGGGRRLPGAGGGGGGAPPGPRGAAGSRPRGRGGGRPGWPGWRCRRTTTCAAGCSWAARRCSPWPTRWASC